MTPERLKEIRDGLPEWDVSGNTYAAITAVGELLAHVDALEKELAPWRDAAALVKDAIISVESAPMTETEATLEFFKGIARNA